MKPGIPTAYFILLASMLVTAPPCAKEIERVPGPGFVRVPFKTADTSVTIEDNVEVFRRFDHGKLIVEYRGKSYRLFYPSGALQESGKYDQQDKRDGLRQRFREDRSLELEERWIHGKLDGMCRLLNKDGSIHAEAEYKKGQVLRGRWMEIDGSVAYAGSDPHRFEEVFGERKGLEMKDFRKLFKAGK